MLDQGMMGMLLYKSISQIIYLQFVSSYSPKSNRVIERKNYIIPHLANAMLDNVGLSKA